MSIHYSGKNASDCNAVYFEFNLALISKDTIYIFSQTLTRLYNATNAHFNLVRMIVFHLHIPGGYLER